MSAPSLEQFTVQARSARPPAGGVFYAAALDPKLESNSKEGASRPPSLSQQPTRSNGMNLSQCVPRSGSEIS